MTRIEKEGHFSRGNSISNAGNEQTHLVGLENIGKGIGDKLGEDRAILLGQ